MRSASLASALALGAFVPSSGAVPTPIVSRDSSNPFVGRKLSINHSYAASLEATFEAFIEEGDELNARKTRTVQGLGTFQWAPAISLLANLDTAISAARAEQNQGGVPQVVGLVLYNLPDRDCSAGESAGELSGRDGLRRYKNEYVDAWATRLSRASDLTFAVVVEPDAVGNMVTNQGVPLCAEAKPIYEEGIAYAISKLQLPNVNLYLDASHGGWLGWPDNLPLAAQQFKDIVDRAGNNATIRGFSTNVSNYNPFHATVRENYTEWSPSWDEDHYTSSLAPYLEELDLPTRFIVDQSRVHLPGAREEWGEWCNVAPAGLGAPQKTDLENPYVDSLTWVKPPGESDGRCGLEGAPAAGQWFNEYVQMLVENADEDVQPADSLERETKSWWPQF
ncbi:endoglucanase-6B [Emericellopsis atlantica]|uniref:Glucanase n=1 Tax=Emericellopsis atlantica TaxID=2614577 RepID=A0A9P7ZD08_9HYPO|nr:endoglucanase-6B [Emericellopsis atlantica]KAG9249804.1 endoglucanase-6B [Emericellopsis atlantica]